uniref:Uncharacterized protein n=1 Tax=Nelumbo nucifera TaxID=4432 RepID=A0A822ZFT7_NELNU|nr:TPA_asm: hypothetical protein HUJ06_001977 [Nelumbo nucifera]
MSPPLQPQSPEIERTTDILHFLQWYSPNFGGSLSGISLSLAIYHCRFSLAFSLSLQRQHSPFYQAILFLVIFSLAFHLSLSLSLLSARLL